jgi:hypothetical protein
VTAYVVRGTATYIVGSSRNNVLAITAGKKRERADNPETACSHRRQIHVTWARGLPGIPGSIATKCHLGAVRIVLR